MYYAKIWCSVLEREGENGCWDRSFVNSVIQCINSAFCHILTCICLCTCTWLAYTQEPIFGMPLPTWTWIWYSSPCFRTFFRQVFYDSFSLLRFPLMFILILRCWRWRKPFLECQVFISPHNIFMHLKHQGLPSRGRDDQRVASMFLGCFRTIILSFIGSHLPLFFSPCRHLGQRAFSLWSNVLWLMGMKYSVLHRNPWNLEVKASAMHSPFCEQTTLKNSQMIKGIPQK